MKKIFTGVLGVMVMASCSEKNSESEKAESVSVPFNEATVYKNEDVEIRQIDEHTWHGNGHLMYNESIYIIEGDSAALLLDAGTTIPGLRKIVEGIVNKPVTLIATHVHPDHTGMAINEWESMWMNEADEVNVPAIMPDYKGEKLYLQDGQVFDLGGRSIEVVFTPGHTPGSTTFIDKEAHYGFSGDAFGSGNLLVFTTLDTVISSCDKMASYLEENGIDKLYPGHYWGNNVETLQRVKDVAEISKGILDGSIEPEMTVTQKVVDFFSGLFGLNSVKALPYVVEQRGVRINYRIDN